MNRFCVLLGIAIVSPSLGCDVGSGGGGGDGSSGAPTTSGTSSMTGSSASTGLATVSFPDACPDTGTYAWDMGLSGSGGTTWSISGTVHLPLPLEQGRVCMLFQPYVVPGPGEFVSVIGAGVCLPPMSWLTSDITYRWTSNFPSSPIDEKVEFYVDDDGDGKPSSGEVHGWFDGGTSTPIHKFEAARPIHIDAGNCPQHVDFGVGSLP